MTSMCHPEVTDFLQNYVKPSKDVSDSSGMYASVFNDVIEKHCAKLGMNLPGMYAGDHPLLKVRWFDWFHHQMFRLFVHGCASVTLRYLSIIINLISLDNPHQTADIEILGKFI